MTQAFKAFPRYELLGLPMMSWTAIIAVIIIFIVMTRTTLGRSFYAVGGFVPRVPPPISDLATLSDSMNGF